MLQLTHSLQHWQQADFSDTFLGEVSSLSLQQLPLQQAMSVGNMVTDDPPTIMINGSQENEDAIVVRTGVFFSSIIAGCSCADDPTPVDTNPEYCELEFVIDKTTAYTRVSIVG